MTARTELAARLLSMFPGCAIEPMAGDASTREFFRIETSDGETRVVMDYGSPFEPEPADVRMSRLFLDAGLPVARVLAAVPDPGFLVLEDLGRTTLEQALRAAPTARCEALNLAAVRLARDVAVLGTAALAALREPQPALDAERFRFEMEFFLEHFAGQLRGLTDPPRELRARLLDLAESAAETPSRVLCHRDFHSRNLVLRDSGSLAMVDIQDARWGPDTYDLASLLRDAYVDLDETQVERLLEHYRGSLPDPPDGPAFRRRFDLVAAQRMIKALGTFGYQAAVVGRASYLEAVPRTVSRLDRLLPRRPETAGVHVALAASGLLER